MSRAIGRCLGVLLMVSWGLTAAAGSPPAGAVQIDKSQMPAEWKSGEPLAVVVSGSTADNAKIAGYQIYAYLGQVPADCSRLTWPLKKSVPAKWGSYQIKQHQWLPQPLSGKHCRISCTLDTKSWPEGDYCLHLLLTVVVDKKDYYQPVNILFTLHK